MAKRKHIKKAMPQRPRQHELDTEAIEFIRWKLPNSWTREEVNQDYGKDIIVEIFEGGEATGLEFRIQSKGHEKFTIVRGNQVSQSLKVSTINYYERLLLPVILVVFDAQKKYACYLWIKPYIQHVLDKEKPNWRDLGGNSEVIFHVPLSQKLEEKVFQDIYSHVEEEHSKLRIHAGESIGIGVKNILSAETFQVSTRVIRPKIKNYLHRSRLTNKLSTDLVKRNLFIQANAGYGKTWLLQDFINENNPPTSVWFTFRNEPLNLSIFVYELASELFNITAGIGYATLNLLRTKGGDVNLDEALAVLIDEIGHESHQQILFIFEDLHNVSDKNIISSIITFVSSCPDNLRIILTSRLPLPYSQTKLVAQEHLTIIDQSSLEFDLNETLDYLKITKNINLTSENAQFLYERTSGWIAAVSLATDALSANPNLDEELFRRLTGYSGNIYDFFAEEVYNALSPEIRSIIKRLSITEAIQPKVVNLLTGRNDGGQILKDLARYNAFLFEDQNKSDFYHFHILFAEFLQTRFKDEEGDVAVQQAHQVLATFYASRRDWYLAAEHATLAEDWQIAIQSLEIVGPIGVSSGYGQFLISWLEKIPLIWRMRSALICELEGLSALQIGDLDLADKAFIRANEQYVDKQDSKAEQRLKYYSAEIVLEKGSSTPEEFLRLAHQIASWCFEHNEILFGAQVELRLIQVGQTLSLKYRNLFSQLIERSQALVKRLEPLGSEFSLIRAKILASQAHLIFQGVTTAFEKEVGKIHLREKLGHPIPIDERIPSARMVLDGIQIVWDLYDKAEGITKEENEIEWAVIRSSHLTDFAHHLSQLYLMSLMKVDQLTEQSREIKPETKTLLYGILAEFDRCAKVFGKYHQAFALAKLLCDAADIYDALGEVNNRDRLAKEALEIASTKSFAELKKRAEDLIQNKNTLTELREKTFRDFGDRELSKIDEEGKANYVNTILRSFAGNVDIEKMRNGIASDVEDMAAVAKQRLEWCRHIEIIQDLQHTKSLETMYREIPKKMVDM